MRGESPSPAPSARPLPARGGRGGGGQRVRSGLSFAISALHVAYGQSEVLHGLNVSVAPNEIVAIMGRNGMGKTTLMKSLMGILPANKGSIAMDANELSPLKSYE